MAGTPHISVDQEAKSRNAETHLTLSCSYKIFKKYVCVPVCPSAYTGVWGPQRPEEGTVSPGAETTDTCESHDMGEGNRAQLLYRSSICL